MGKNMRTILIVLMNILSANVFAGAMVAQEYPISPSDLITFSSNQVKARLCSNCEISTVKVAGNTQFFEQNTPIDLKRATELYVSPKYKRVSLHINNQTKTMLIIRFGEFIENSDPAE